ncbi:hypothetical protein NQ317_003983 [Molorchus minor]|uniref:Uncharacterized protein n=1 Tax=Molorchus minor TaxID=1323400 RepID=A0ABQ9K1B0_9CUCU|nr:hypothetical protein NQ317_003983 [Molorchus minor]
MSAQKIKQLRAQRNTDIHRVKELKTIADRALVERDIHAHFKMRYKHLDLVFDDFEKQHTALIALLSVDETANLDPETQLFENDVSVNNQTHIVEESFTRSVNVKLPKIEIPKFDGDLKNWQSFIGLFNSLVHENESLSNIEKFNYMITSLKNAPLALAKCTPLAGENYLVAYNALKNRYENHRLIASTHWHEMVNAKKITAPPNNSQPLRQLLDIFTENVAALNNLGYRVDGWDFPLFFMLLDRIDSDTVTKFEMSLPPDTAVPAFQVLVDFLNKKCNALETVSHSYQMNTRRSFDNTRPKPNQNNLPRNTFINRQSSLFTNTTNNKLSCPLCNSEHLIYSCPSFISKTPQERYNIVKTNNWCTNCLGSKHGSTKCSSRTMCKRCSCKHHTLLHFNATHDLNNITQHSTDHIDILAPSTSSNENAQPRPSTSTQVNTAILSTETTVLLSTAQIEVLDCRGHYQTVRVLLDSGSQANFITEKCCNKLGLPRFNVSLAIQGMGPMSSNTSQAVTCTIRAEGQPTPLYKLDFAILPKICSDMPTFDLPKQHFTHLKNLRLADNRFALSSPIDMLLGAEAYRGEPSAFNTIFGWIVMGKVNYAANPPLNALFTTVDYSLESTLKRFWEIEQVPHVTSASPSDVLAEKLFVNTHSRTESGRYIVSLPFREIEPHFEGSRDSALRQFYSLERRLIKNPALYKDYRGFELRKWASNHSSILSHLPQSSLQLNPLTFDQDNETIKILGLQWHPSADIFSYQVDILDRSCTKRSILSDIALLWSLGLEWDQPPPDDVLNRWSLFKEELSLLSKLQIFRQLITESYLHCELHGFCDASEKGFAAVVYFRVLVDQTNIKTFFVCAKAKVAPLKRVTLPRLELCAAVLLTWTDSSVTLAWIKSSPHRWHTFVSNRISHIQDKVSPCQWFHVMSHDNPADCASRGLLPSELIHHPLWWAGPPWLSDHRENWPENILNISSSPPETSQEEKKNIFITCLTFDMQLDTLLERYSTLSKISRIISYVLRFANNCRQRKQDRNFGAPTLSELDKSVLIFVKHSQHSSFSEEISRLRSGKVVPRWLRKLNPFLDDMGVLRVGGRLIKSDLSYERKHPALLQSKHKLTTLIIEYTHRIYLHPGLQTLQFLLAQRYWIRAPKRTIRRVLASCYKCWRVNPSSPQPPMGNLPAARISQRSKWYDHATPILPNTMVVLKDDLTPPLRWLLGRVDAIHPGADGVTRVVSGASPGSNQTNEDYHRREYQVCSTRSYWGD